MRLLSVLFTVWYFGANLNISPVLLFAFQDKAYDCQDHQCACTSYERCVTECCCFPKEEEHHDDEIELVFKKVCSGPLEGSGLILFQLGRHLAPVYLDAPINWSIQSVDFSDQSFDVLFTDRQPPGKVPILFS